MAAYWLYKAGKKFCFTQDKKQAEAIAEANDCTIVEININ